MELDPPVQINYLHLPHPPCDRFFFANQLIYQPPLPGYNEATARIQIIPTAQGAKTAIFYLPASPEMPTLFWSHGNAEDIGHLRERFQSFHARGYGILAYD